MSLRVGGPIFVLTEDDLLVYSVESTGNLVACRASASGAPCPSIGSLDVIQSRIPGEYQLAGHPEWDVAVLPTGRIGLPESECRRLYIKYKQLCPIDLFGFKIPAVPVQLDG